MDRSTSRIRSAQLTPRRVNMVAISAELLSPPLASAAAVFGGLIDISRLLLPAGRSTPVVCSTCQTLNRRSAEMCKGCDGKLPAYYAGSGWVRPGAAATTPVSPAAPRFRVPAQWITVAWASALVILLFTAFGIWFERHTGAVRRPPLMDTVLRAAVAAPLVQLPAPMPPARPFQVDAEPLRAVSLPDEMGPQPVEVRPVSSTSTAGRSPAPGRHAVPKRLTPAPSTVSIAASPRMESDPIAHCRSRSLFARAVCANDTCARRALAHHPSCAQAVAQRRLDEARRNPVMLN